MKRYPIERIYEEISYIAYHFHWSSQELMNMDHGERRKWCEEIRKINEKISSDNQKE
jgi:hypothetical protein